MVTYAQLEAEAYWRNERVHPEMQAFGVRLCKALGVGTNAFGVKGDNEHRNGGHRSQEWILKSKYCTNRTYTVESGLSIEESRLISAFDITPKSRDDMLRISRNLDKVVRAGQLEGLVEWFGNTNNDTVVDGYDNIRNAVIRSDPSHLWHLHGRSKRRLSILGSRWYWDQVFNALVYGRVAETPQEAADLDVNQAQKLDAVFNGWETVKLDSNGDGKPNEDFPVPLVTKWLKPMMDKLNAIEGKLNQ